MKKYEFVNIQTNSPFGGDLTAHRDIINNYAQKGYRFAGWVPTYISGEGKIYRLDLIFEIDE